MLLFAWFPLLLAVKANAIDAVQQGRRRTASTTSCSASSSLSGADDAIRVSLGSDFEATGSRVSFDPQGYLKTGTVFEIETSRRITGVKEGYPESLYQTLVQSESPFTYAIPLPVGVSSVRIVLHFCELTSFDVGTRMFNVKVEDEFVFEDVDIVDQAGNYFALTLETGSLSVLDEVVDIEFLPIRDFAVLSGIEVFPNTNQRFNLGSDLTVVGPDGLSFDGTTALQFVTSGNPTQEVTPGATPETPIADVEECYPEELYHTRVIGPDFTYAINFDISIQRLDIILHFCEGTDGNLFRTTGVEINGDPVIEEQIIAGGLAGSLRAVTKFVRYYVDPSNPGVVNIRIFGGNGDALLNGMEILPVVSTEPVRINMGSYETVVGDNGGLVFGSYAQWMFNDENVPDRAVPLGGGASIPDWQEPNSVSVTSRLGPTATLEPGVPEELYSTIATGVFCIKIPISWTGFLAIRLHFRRSSGLDGNTYLDVSSMGSIYSDTRARTGSLSFVRLKEHIDVDEVFVAETQVFVADTSLFLFIWDYAGFINSQNTIPMVSGIEVFPSSGAVSIGNPIRIKEGSGDFDFGQDWLPASDFRTSSGTLTVDFAQPDEAPNPIYPKELYQNCAYRYNASITYEFPAVGTHFDVRVHLPMKDRSSQDFPHEPSFEFSFDILVNGEYIGVGQVGTDGPRIYSNMGRNSDAVVTAGLDGMVRVELLPYFMMWAGVCGIELYPIDTKVIRANTVAYNPSPSCANCWPLAYGPLTFYTAPDTLVSPEAEVYKIERDFSGTIDEHWTRLYPEQMLRTYITSTGFDQSFVFRFASPRTSSGLVQFARLRLLFLELRTALLGKRAFHVNVNSVRVLTNYTMTHDNWLSHSLVIEDFPIAINNRETIEVEFVTPPVDTPEQPNTFTDPVSGELINLYPTAMINGMEILATESRLHIDGIRINAGGRGYGRDFIVDDYYSGDEMNVIVTDSGTARSGMNLTYLIPVVPTVTFVFVRLHFVELEGKAIGERTCHVDIEGTRVKEAFDIAEEASLSGAQSPEASIQEFFAVGLDRKLEISLSSADNVAACLISSIEVLPWSPFVDDSQLLDCGQEASPYGGPSYPFERAFGVVPNVYVNATGHAATSQILTAYQSSLGIKNVPLDVPQRVLKSMVYGQDFSYSFQVQSQHVRIICHFADNCWDQNVESLLSDTTCGVREMDVYLQGIKVLSRFAAAPLTTYSKSFDIWVPDRLVELRFDSIDKTDEFKFAFVNAIEVINLKPFTLNAGSSLYNDFLAYGHYVLNTQSPRQWATQKDVLNNKDYPQALYQTAYGSKDLSYEFPCQAKQVLIRLHFCDITEENVQRWQRIYVDDEIVLENLDPKAAAVADYEESTNKRLPPDAFTGVAYSWDKLHYRSKSNRKVKVRIQSQIPGVQAILSAIQVIPLFDNEAFNFRVSLKNKDLGTQNVVGYHGELVKLAFKQTYSVRVNGTHGYLIIKFKEMYKDLLYSKSDTHACLVDHRSRYNSLYLNGRVVLEDFDVCELAGGYLKQYIWSGSALAGDDGMIVVEASSSRPYDYPIVDEIEVFSHYIMNDEVDEAGSATTEEEDEE